MARRALPWFGSIAGFLLGVALACPAYAETPVDRKLAQKLAGEALDLFKARDFESAMAKFQEADRLVPAPTLKVRVARCLVQLGRMREAAEHYREVIALELKSTSPKVHHEARDEAVRELAKLIEETPKLTVVLSGESEAAVEVTVDGKSLGAALGQPQMLDPGTHAIVVSVGTLRVEKAVTLERGHSERVVLGIPRAPATRDERPAAGSGEASSAMRIAGYSLVGVGGAGLVVGAIGTGLLYRDRGTLDSLCPAGPCYRDEPNAVAVAERFNRERIVASAGFIGGGVIGAAGATLLILAATGSASGSASEKGVATSRAMRLLPVVSPQFIGVAGTF
ncbi:MAG: hypothetical protein FJ096_17655 [Deltaproteobacteria bacterium]|nr:hypothetical protein [Deltaproteobacteria bacterium]